tara:strand:+ start:266 stop:616 length:351 start_codon:yes stop_codon:yes gene_type:complete
MVNPLQEIEQVGAVALLLQEVRLWLLALPQVDQVEREQLQVLMEHQQLEAVVAAVEIKADQAQPVETVEPVVEAKVEKTDQVLLEQVELIPVVVLVGTLVDSTLLLQEEVELADLE